MTETKKDYLVSVLVVSYNAKQYITELLESIKAQTHTKLELIVADDASKDNTVEVIEKWIAGNKERFVDCKVIAAKANKGTCRNLNDGIAACNGKYIKIIAADDILFPTCIEDCLTYCIENNAGMVIGDALWVLDDGVTETPHLKEPIPKEVFYNMSAAEQYKVLLEHNSIICTPGEFYEKEFLERYGCFDEEYDIIEDYPFWLKITKAGEQIHYLDKKVVKYRQSLTSATNPEKNTTIFNVRASKASKRIFYRLRFKGLLKEKKIGILLKHVKIYLIRDMVIGLGNSGKNIFCRVLRRFV